MTEIIKNLVFKGITKREEILFKSFLNLAKNELNYQVLVLRSGDAESGTADIVIRDQSYQFEDEEELQNLPTIIVGDDPLKKEANYISRPVQWSDFKLALTGLDVEFDEQGEPVDRVLPDEVRFAIAEEIEPTPTELKQEQADAASVHQYSDEGDYEYSLDKMSVDYHSVTNSDYVRAADDVKQFKNGDATENQEPVILVSDDESGFANSVLVIETNSIDAWDFTQSELTVSQIVSEPEQEFEEPESEDEVVEEKRSGFEVKIDEEYWLEDNEIIIDGKSFMFIKPARAMVYSKIEPGRWPALLQRRTLFKLPLPDEWRPEKGLGVYPISSLLWVNTLINETEQLFPDLDEDEEYMLEKWPPFNLLELDNVLLKLCTMMFVRPESVGSLARKSGYGRSTIRGLMNACHEMGCLTTPDHIDMSKMVPVAADEGMLGKIKDVFR